MRKGWTQIDVGPRPTWRRDDGAIVKWDDSTPHPNPRRPSKLMLTGWGPSGEPVLRTHRGKLSESPCRWGMLKRATQAVDRIFPLYNKARYHKMKRWSKADIECLRGLWENHSAQHVATILSRTADAVRYRAKLLGLPKSPDYSANREFHPVFPFWRNWSAELAYILGFIAADGNVYKTRLQMQLQERDGYILHRFAMLGGGITFPIPHNRSVGWTLSGPSFVATLKDLGIHPQKTHRMTLPFVPRNLQPHFVRGYCDGDGTIGTYRVQRGRSVNVKMVGNAAFLSGLREVIYSHVEIYGKTDVRLANKRSLYEIAFTTREDVLRLLAWMYDGATLCLDRKRDKANEVIAVASGMSRTA